MGGGGNNEVKETAQERALAEVALGRFNRYMTRFKGFEDKFIADVTGPTGAKEKRTAGHVNADIAQRTTGAIPAGVDPSGGAPGSASPALEAGKVGAASQVDANMNVKGQRVQGIQAAIDIGRGQGSTAQLGMEGLAADSVGTAIGKAENKFNTRAAMGEAIGSAVGTAAGIGMNYRRPSASDLKPYTDSQGGKYLSDGGAVRVKPVSGW